MNMQSSGLALENVGVLADLDAYALQEVAAVMRPVTLSGGDMLFDEGDFGDTLYIVVHGRLAISVATANGLRRVVAELGRGESVGEMALLTGERRSARVEAIRDSLLLALSRAAFERVVEQHPRIMMQLARQLVVRLKSSLRGAPARTVLSTLCVKAAVPGVPIESFCERLARELNAVGPTLHLTRARVDSVLSAGGLALPVPGADDTRLLAWLNEQEEAYAFVLYEADERDDVWSRLCERQADRVAVVASVDCEPPSVSKSAPRASPDKPQSVARREFVLLNQSGPVAGAMQRWLDAVPDVRGWHHVTLSDSKGFSRLARLLVGQGIGLLLGGGGARAFAHIGVMRAMHEAGIEVDAVGGVSGGAVVGAQYAAGASPAEIKECVRAEFIGRGSLLDFTVPVVSLIRGRRFVDMLQRLFGHSSIEDLPLRFFCLSANLTRACMKVHERGVLWHSIGASMSIPGIGPPACHDGDLLIDGSVLTNLPVDAMREVCQGRVVAIDVSAEKDLTVDRSWTEFPSPARLLAARPWRPRLSPVPTILEILFRGAMLGSIAGERNVEERVDFYLRPPLRGVRLLDFKALDRVETTAYEYAVRALEHWPFGRVS